MKTKSIALLCASFLALFLIIGSVSALTLAATVPNVLNYEGDSTSFTVTSDVDSDFTLPASPMSNSDFTISLSKTDGVNSTEIEVTLDDISSDFEFGDSTQTITIYTEEKLNTSNNNTIDVIIKLEKDFYEGDNDGELEVSIDGDFNVEGFGDDDEWYLLDEIEVEVNVENSGDYDIKDIEIEACLFDIEEDECVLDEGDMDISEDKFDLDESDDLDIKLTFILDADDFTEDTDDFKLYIRAIGELDGNEADDDGVEGDDTGAEDSEDASVIIPNDFVVLSNIEIQESASCGDEVILTADVWNIGDDDQGDIFVKVYSPLLGLNEVIEMDIDALENDDLNVKIMIPEDAEDKRYDIKITIYDDEDMSDNDIYEEDNEESEFTAYLTVNGCILQKDVEVSAIAKSGGVAGGETVVEVTVVNTGSKLETFSLRSLGYDSWANEASIDKSTFAISAGESEIITITLDVKDETVGENQFEIEIAANGEIAETKSILVSIEKKEGFSLSNIFGDANWSLIGIIALNIILLIAIIVVAVRIIRKK